MKDIELPDNVERLEDHQPFAFSCHENVNCFTHCCRQLELVLTPYDILRLKNNLQISSTEFLERYVIIEQDEQDAFPRMYLTMVDDGNASCIFVTNCGCTVYKDRPAACRAYPIGRAAMRMSNNDIEQFFVLLRENHCRGFEEKQLQTPHQYSTEQGLDKYNTFNDALVRILQHEQIRQGKRLTKEQIDEFILALYDIDSFRAAIQEGKINCLLPPSKNNTYEDDENLLLVAIDWLQDRLFSSE